MQIRFNWTSEEVHHYYQMPLLELIRLASQTHCTYHEPNEIQVCSLISIKTGGCPENCKYCAQSSSYQTSTQATPLMALSEVIETAKRAVASGATRVCLGAAWKEVRDSIQFEQVLNMIKEINKLGIEVCVTLGMLSEHQAQRLKEAGLYAYNHNLDTSEEYYPNIVTTRTYADRLKTLDHVRQAGITVCCGGIIGLGESTKDRIKLLQTLANFNPHPESVPINFHVPIKGTPLENQPQLSIWEMIRTIAVARIIMPKTIIRLSAGREKLSKEQQTLCFLSGANSVFSGEKLLTVSNFPWDEDDALFKLLGIKKKSPFHAICQPPVKDSA